MRLMRYAAAALAAVCVAGRACAGFGDEEIVDCNGGDGWVASVAGARPGATSYVINIVDTGSVRTVVKPGRSLSGWTGDRSPVTSSGTFEWRGHDVQRVVVYVRASKVSPPAYAKIHELLKKRAECALTVRCNAMIPDHADLIGAEFPKIGKKFAAGADGKVREVQAK